MRFLVKGYVPPHRIEHDLTERQRRILFLLRDGAAHALKDLHAGFEVALPQRTLQADLALLRTLGLVEFIGRGRGARWRLIPTATGK